MDSNKRKVSRSHNLLEEILEEDPTQMKSRKFLVPNLIRMYVKPSKEAASVGQTNNPKKKEKVGSLILRAKLKSLFRTNSKRMRAVLMRSQMQAAISLRKILRQIFLIT